MNGSKPLTPAMLDFVDAVVEIHPELSPLMGQLEGALAEDSGTGWLEFDNVHGLPCTVEVDDRGKFTVMLPTMTPERPSPYIIYSIEVTFGEDLRIENFEFLAAGDDRNMDYAAIATWLRTQRMYA